MSARVETLEIATSPHLLSGARVDHIMRHVLIALTPTSIFAVHAFGLAALAILLTSVVACALTELACNGGEPSSLRDGSALVTGVLFGLTLPPGLPLWMVALGAAVALGVGKAVFGGLGANPFNPALVGRAFLQAAFPLAMTRWEAPFAVDRFATLPTASLTLPFLRARYADLPTDGVTQATPLAAWKFGGVLTEPGALAWGATSGSLGETSAVWILVGGVYLIALGVMSWRIPVAIGASVALATWALQLLAPGAYPSVAFMLLSGGLMLGATFMATDLVGSPMTHGGAWIYGALIGGLVVVLRCAGGMPEGVMYAILLANATTPLIDEWIRPRPFGSAQRRGQGARS